MSAEAARLGFYGKLPARGDFLGRRLPGDFIAAWDDWLQQAIATSREQLGEDWLPRYLEAPLWRLFLPAGLCGASAVAGIMMASVDRVGRYFPLLLALPLAEGTGWESVLAADAWFARVEELALTALDEDFDFDGFDAALTGEPVPEFTPPGEAVFALGEAQAAGFGAAEPPSRAALRLFAGAALERPLALWWSLGSAAIAPMLLAMPALPPADGFAALLDGQWERWGWKRR